MARSWVEDAVEQALAVSDAGPHGQGGEVKGGESQELGPAPGELEVLIGTMIETPRAALRAGEIAEEAEFFSFGTNDLTQMVFGFCATTSRAG